MDRADPVKVKEVKDIEAHLGKRAVLEGTAQDAKSGAVVEGGDFVVYVHQLDQWPPNLVGKRVRATGVLVKRKEIPDPVVDEYGGVSQGAEGDQYILEEAHWEAI